MHGVWFGFGFGFGLALGVSNALMSLPHVVRDIRIRFAIEQQSQPADPNIANIG